MALRIAYLVDQFPELTETFVSGEVLALRALGHAVHVESEGRPSTPGASAGPVSYLVDDTRGARLRDLAWLTARHPVRCLRDLTQRRRWRGEEEVRPLRWLGPAARRIDASGAQHVHAHFAMGAALDAMRVGALLGVPYSVMTHGYDIFQTPRNLLEKHRRAAFAVTASDYSARHLPPGTHALVMGVDGDVWRRSRPHIESRTVIAVARLTEKKGLAVLAAAAKLIDARVIVVGDGPLRGRLRGLELLGARTPDEIRELVQDAAVLVAPSVIAADGDRDTMPVVVKEALALEVPVIASDAVGLPEVVKEPWGRLFPPGDAAALADAIAEVLAMSVTERAAVGAAGRAFVLEHCSLRGQAERLSDLIGQAAADRERQRR